MSTPLLQQFPSLASHPASFLKDLLSSPELVEAFLFTLPEVQQLAADIERIGKENEQLAKGNLALQDELLALREATAQSYGHAEALKVQWQEIEKAQSQLYQRNRPSFLHLRLKHSITAQDDLSERIASAFIEGRPIPPGMGGSDRASGLASVASVAGVSGAVGGSGGSGTGSRVDSPAPGEMGERASRRVWREETADQQGQGRAIDDFIAEFKAARKTYHKRAIWAERWTRGEVAWRDD